MKKILFLTLLVSCIQSSKAQSWCPPGATWYYSVWSGLLGYDAVVEYKYTADTTLLNKSCKIIKGTFSGQDMQDYNTLSYTTVPNYQTYYTYENNQVVYLFTGGQFDTVVNYNAAVGDKWLVNTDCGWQRSNTVTAVSSITVNNVSLRSITANFTYTYMNGGNPATYSNHVTYIEKIQGAEAGSWKGLFPGFCNEIDPSEMETPWTYFCGYTDNNFPLHMSGGDGCRLITGIQENSKKNNNFKFYPNPNNGNFTIEVTEASSIKIYNSLGDVLQENSFNSDGSYGMKLSTLANGIYYIQITNESGYLNSKFVKE